MTMKIVRSVASGTALAALGLSACNDAEGVGGRAEGAEGVAAKQSQLYVLSGSVWPSLTIPVCWESTAGVQTERAWVRDAVAQTWEANAGSNLTFSGWGACTATSTGIRIGVSDTGPHVKVLGSGLNGMANGMVLNFTFNNWSPSCSSSREYCIRAIAVHEFGHALGFAHEQNRPDTPSWCDQEQGTDGDVTIGAWDLASVMNYCNPNWNGNGQLSAGDIAGLRTFYGRPFEYQGDAGWWASDSYSPNAITDRVVSGDFNGDGRDDISMLYRYSTNTTRAHVLLARPQLEKAGGAERCLPGPSSSSTHASS